MWRQQSWNVDLIVINLNFFRRVVCPQKPTYPATGSTSSMHSLSYISLSHWLQTLPVLFLGPTINVLSLLIHEVPTQMPFPNDHQTSPPPHPLYSVCTRNKGPQTDGL